MYICDHILFIHLSVDGRLDCFCVLAIVNSAAMNIGVHVSFRIVFFSEYMPGVGLQGHVVALLLVFKGTSILFSIVALSTDIPAPVQEGSLFSTPCPAFILCRFFLMMPVLTGVRCYLIVVLTCIFHGENK